MRGAAFPPPPQHTRAHTYTYTSNNHNPLTRLTTHTTTDPHSPTLVATPPDLLDPVTYREADATAFFARVDVRLASGSWQHPVCLHICVCLASSCLSVCLSEYLCV